MGNFTYPMGGGAEAGRALVDPLPLCGTVFCSRQCPHRPWGPSILLSSAYRGLFPRRCLVPFGCGTNPHSVLFLLPLHELTFNMLMSVVPSVKFIYCYYSPYE
jgi:hypothetical protein